MKMSLAEAETFITFPHTSPRKSQKHIPKKSHGEKLPVRPPRLRRGTFDIDPRLPSRRGYPLPPPKIKIPLEKLRVWGGRDPPSGGEEWSVPFLSSIIDVRTLGAAATTAIAKNFLFNFFFFIFFVYFRSFFISFHFFHPPSSVPPIRAATPPPREGTWPP